MRPILSKLLIFAAASTMAFSSCQSPEVKSAGGNESPTAAPAPAESPGVTVPTVKNEPPAAPSSSRTEQIALRSYSVPAMANLRKEEAGRTAIWRADSLIRASRLIEEKSPRTAKDGYEKALEWLKEVAPSDELKAGYLRGHTLFLLKRYHAAAREFSVVFERDELKRDDAQWYMLLCKMAETGSMPKDVKKELEQIANDSGHPYGDAAKKILSAK